MKILAFSQVENGPQNAQNDDEPDEISSQLEDDGAVRVRMEGTMAHLPEKLLLGIIVSHRLRVGPVIAGHF